MSSKILCLKKWGCWEQGYPFKLILACKHVTALVTFNTLIIALCKSLWQFSVLYFVMASIFFMSENSQGPQLKQVSIFKSNWQQTWPSLTGCHLHGRANMGLIKTQCPPRKTTFSCLSVQLWGHHGLACMHATCEIELLTEVVEKTHKIWWDKIYFS